MKSLLVVLVFLSSFSVLAGDQYMNCGKGDFYTMEDFMASSVVADGKAYASFSNDLIHYTVLYESGDYVFYKTNINEGGFVQINSLSSGAIKQSKVIDGLTCHIAD